MSNLPQSFEFRCANCKKRHSPRTLARHDAVCTQCDSEFWNIRVTSVDEMDVDEGILNPWGFLIFKLATGTGFYADAAKPSARHSDQWFHNVPASEVRGLCSPPRKVKPLLAAFVAQKLVEAQRTHMGRMVEKGAGRCQQCGVLFVPSSDKPWTLAGTCSKNCCAKKFGESKYARVEKEVLQATENVGGALDEHMEELSMVALKCDSCGREFELSSFYRGTYRKCPNCQQRVLVPPG